MKFIYFTNNIYEQNILLDNIEVINNINKKEEKSKIEIIYGGNQINNISNILLSNNDYDIFLSNMGLLDKKLQKYIMYGGLDLSINKLDNQPNNYDFLYKSICYYNQNINFKYIFNIDYKLVNDVLLIFYNNQINYIESPQILIKDTNLKYLFQLNPTKYLDTMTINDLIEMEIEELGYILKKNINIKSIIFISQSPLLIPNYSNNKIEINKEEKFFEWINRYFYLLNNLKLYWLCGDLVARNEFGTILVEKKDNQNNIISQLIINQYIIGTNCNFAYDESIQNSKVFDLSYTTNIIIGHFDIKYTILNTNQDYGFIEFNIDDKSSSNISVNFVNVQKLILDKKTKIEGLKKKNIIEENIFNNIDISIDGSINDSIDDSNNQLTEEGDPYKEKYIKYKKKLHKLRNNKK